MKVLKTNEKLNLNNPPVLLSHIAMLTKTVFTYIMTPDFKEYLEARAEAEDGITLWDNYLGFSGVYVYRVDGDYFFQFYNELKFSLGRSSSGGSFGMQSFAKIKLKECENGNLEALFEVCVYHIYKIIIAVIASLWLLFMLFNGLDIIVTIALVGVFWGGFWLDKKVFLKCFNTVIRPYKV